MTQAEVLRVSCVAQAVLDAECSGVTETSFNNVKLEVMIIVDVSLRHPCKIPRP